MASCVVTQPLLEKLFAAVVCRFGPHITTLTQPVFCTTAEHRSVIVNTSQPFVFLPPETEAHLFLCLMCFTPRSKRLSYTGKTNLLSVGRSSWNLSRRFSTELSFLDLTSFLFSLWPARRPTAPGTIHFAVGPFGPPLHIYLDIYVITALRFVRVYFNICMNTLRLVYVNVFIF